ncbi:MAG: hypothetical protein NUV59_00615 [Patescibacteria group bacterium]|nr:hypothetical protein [Patescibacteria group bacterium]
MTTNERTYQVIIGVLAVIVLILGWWIITHPSAGSSMASDSETAAGMDGTSDSDANGGSVSGPISDSVPTTTGSGEQVSVAAQPAGSSVAVASATLSQPGWVAVRDASGRTLGAAWFDAGTHTDISVPLLRATEAGQNYQVLLYVDSGEGHRFDLHQDILITNADGSVAGTTFSAQ